MQFYHKKCNVKTRDWGPGTQRVSEPVCRSSAGLRRRPLLTRGALVGASWAFTNQIAGEEEALDFRSLEAGPGTEHPHHLSALG